MHVITFQYATSPLRNAIEQREDTIKRFEFKECHQDSALYGCLFDNMAYGWMVTTIIAIFAVAAACIVLSLLIYAAMRIAAAPRDKASIYAFNVISIGIAVLSFNVLLWASFYLISIPLKNDAKASIPHPDYEQALTQTIENNYNDINDAVHLVAKSQHIDLERACEHGKYTLPQASKPSTTQHLTETTQLVQCGGEIFGALLYTDAGTMKLQSISTSTGAGTFTVIATTGDAAQDKAATYSSVQFPGVDETKYKPSSQGKWYACDVDNSYTPGMPKPYSDDVVMTLDEARKRDNNAASSH